MFHHHIATPFRFVDITDDFLSQQDVFQDRSHFSEPTLVLGDDPRKDTTKSIVKNFGINFREHITTDNRSKI